MFSVEDDRLPEAEGYVRAVIYSSVFHCVPNSKDISNSEFHNIIHTNPRGSLPYWVVKKAIEHEMVNTYVRIKEVLNV